MRYLQLGNRYVCLLDTPLANTKLDCYEWALFNYLKPNEQDETDMEEWINMGFFDGPMTVVCI